MLNKPELAILGLHVKSEIKLESVFEQTPVSPREIIFLKISLHVIISNIPTTPKAPTSIITINWRKIK